MFLQVVKDYLVLMTVVILALNFYNKLLTRLIININRFLGKKQLEYIGDFQKRKLIICIKLELFLDKVLTIFTVYFPDLDEPYNEFNNLIMRKNRLVEVFNYILDRFFRPQILNLLVFAICLWINNIDIQTVLKHQYINWLVQLIREPKNLPGLLIGLIILISVFFTSKYATIIRGVNKVNKETLDKMINFHNQNRILLSEIAIVGHRNLDKVFNKRKVLQKYITDETQVNDYEKKTLKLMFETLESLNGLDKLYNFVNGSEEAISLFFFLKMRDISFSKLHHIYYEYIGGDRENDIRIKKSLRSIYYDKEYFNESNIKSFSKKYNFDLVLRENIKKAVEIDQYLKAASNMFNKSNSLFLILSFVTNKETK